MSDPNLDKTQPLSDAERENVVAYLDGELDDAAADAMLAQMSRDPTLRREADELQKTWELLDYLPKPSAPAHFTERTLEHLDATKLLLAQRARRWRWVAAAGWGASLTLAALLGFGFAYHWAQPQTVVQTADVLPAVDAPDAPPPAANAKPAGPKERADALRREIARVRNEVNPKLTPPERHRLREAMEQGGLVYMEALLELAKKYDVPLKRPTDRPPLGPDERPRPKKPTPTRGGP
jgi:hypothetical protein